MKCASKKVELWFICERGPATIQPRMHRRTRQSSLVSGYDSNSYPQLRIRLEEMEKNGSSPNHLFYVSTPASVAGPIIEGLGAVGLNRRNHGWTRIVLEKPFGRDLESAQELNEVVRGVFDEKVVYRIDHYLGKETVQNILVFRFSNSLFEPVWNRNYIDYVEITAAETVGVENRAAFYEE